jgi:hypothetical protein
LAYQQEAPFFESEFLLKFSAVAETQGQALTDKQGLSVPSSAIAKAHPKSKKMETENRNVFPALSNSIQQSTGPRIPGTSPGGRARRKR